MTDDGDKPGGRYYGVFKGYVRRNDDPEKRGRLVVYCPQVMGNDDVPSLWLGWAEACLPWMGGTTTAIFGVPPTKDQTGGKDTVGVWLQFEDGKPDFPVWFGVFIVAATPDKGARAPAGITSPITGSLAMAPPAGSDLAELDPVQFHTTDLLGTLAIMTKAGKDIVLVSDEGGSIVIGPSGVIINGQVYINGMLQVPSSSRRTF